MTQNTGVPDINPQALIELTNTRMPFGKYKDRFLCECPEPYLVWFHRQGSPRETGYPELSAIYEIKANGLEYLLKPLKQHKPIG